MADTKKWTIMFYFAGDNALSPLIVSQLRAIKDAGFHRNVDVVVHFDPNEFGAPTRIYDVNRRRKAGRQKVMSGDGPDPYIHFMLEDGMELQTIAASTRPVKGKAKNRIQNPDKINAVDAQRN